MSLILTTPCSNHFASPKGANLFMKFLCAVHRCSGSLHPKWCHNYACWFVHVLSTLWEHPSCCDDSLARQLLWGSEVCVFRQNVSVISGDLGLNNDPALVSPISAYLTVWFKLLNPNEDKIQGDLRTHDVYAIT